MVHNALVQALGGGFLIATPSLVVIAFFVRKWDRDGNPSGIRTRAADYSRRAELEHLAYMRWGVTGAAEDYRRGVFGSFPPASLDPATEVEAPPPVDGTTAAVSASGDDVDDEAAVMRTPPASKPTHHTVSGTGVRLVIRVASGDSVSVSGTGNRVRIDGHFTTLSVSGIGNVVAADSVTSVRISGQGNTVSHKCDPDVQLSGQGNAARRSQWPIRPATRREHHAFSNVCQLPEGARGFSRRYSVLC